MSDRNGADRSQLERQLLAEATGQGLDWKNLVLVALSYKRAKNEEAMSVWFERAIRLALDPDDVTRTSLAYRDVVKGLLSAGELDRASDLALRIPVTAYRDQARAEVASSLARSRRFDEALGLAASLLDAKARAIALAACQGAAPIPQLPTTQVVTPPSSLNAMSG